MRKIFILAIIIFAFAWGYYHYLSTQARLEILAQHSLDDLARSVTTHDQKQLDQTLAQLLTDQAHITLRVHFFTLSQMDGGTPQIQQFDKESFIRFIGTIVYSVEHYGYAARINAFDRYARRQIG